MLLDGRAPTTGIRQRGKEATIFIAFNGHYEPAEFTLPECADGCHWSLLLDTSDPENAEPRNFAIREKCSLVDRSLLLFVLYSRPSNGDSQEQA